MGKPEEDFEEWVSGMSRMIDANIVVISVSTLEDWLKAALKAKMRPLSSTAQARLFEGYGPVSTFSAKIDIAYAFSMIDDAQCSDFKALKDIRNAFAHTSEFIHFNSKEVEPKFQKLSGWKRGGDNKATFQAAVHNCINALKPTLDTAALIRAIREHSSLPRIEREPPPARPMILDGKPRDEEDPPPPSQA